MNRMTALLDANVLYPAGLRDFLLRLADQYLYRPLCSATIHEEWIASLLENRPDLTASRLERPRAIMDEYFPEAIVTGYDSLVWCLTNTLMKMRGHFGCRQGAMICRGDRRSPPSGRYHARKSNAADGQKDPQIRERICETPH